MLPIAQNNPQENTSFSSGHRIALITTLAASIGLIVLYYFNPHSQNSTSKKIDKPIQALKPSQPFQLKHLLTPLFPPVSAFNQRESLTSINTCTSPSRTEPECSASELLKKYFENQLTAYRNQLIRIHQTITFELDYRESMLHTTALNEFDNRIHHIAIRKLRAIQENQFAPLLKQARTSGKKTISLIIENENHFIHGLEKDICARILKLTTSAKSQLEADMGVWLTFSPKEAKHFQEQQLSTLSEMEKIKNEEEEEINLLIENYKKMISKKEQVFLKHISDNVKSTLLL